MVFERYAAIQRVAENIFEQEHPESCSFHKLETRQRRHSKTRAGWRERSRPGLRDQIPQDGIAVFRQKSATPQPCGSQPLIFTGSASKELATSITSFVDESWSGTRRTSREAVKLCTRIFRSRTRQPPTHVTSPEPSERQCREQHLCSITEVKGKPDSQHNGRRVNEKSNTSWSINSGQDNRC